MNVTDLKERWTKATPQFASSPLPSLHSLLS